MKRFLFLASLVFSTLVLATPLIAQSNIRIVPPPAIALDPPQDKDHPAHSAEMVVPSHGEKLFGIFYFAAGADDHPTVVLLHGFPGYEQNLDLAQAMRRAGWNVLALHYRGSWGVGGDFSLEHAMEDADAMVDYVLSDEAAKKLHIDRKRIAVVGHSMGGYMALSTTAHHPTVLGVVGIGTWDISEPARNTEGISADKRLARIEKLNGSETADFIPLHNYSPTKLNEEMLNGKKWDPVRFVPQLATRPVLLMTADDDSEASSTRLQAALKAAGNKQAEKIYTTTNHGFNDKRIYLESIVLNWLSGLIDDSGK